MNNITKVEELKEENARLRRLLSIALQSGEALRVYRTDTQHFKEASIKLDEVLNEL